MAWYGRAACCFAFTSVGVKNPICPSLVAACDADVDETPVCEVSCPVPARACMPRFFTRAGRRWLIFLFSSRFGYPPISSNDELVLLLLQQHWLTAMRWEIGW